jgi:hypothetical protein
MNADITLVNSGRPVLTSVLVDVTSMTAPLPLS